ncbi:hypothetical protein BL250_11795 [Erwinia sp. OLTSP20]|uniref:hypothetical protein n=1 Tax=unclassified Erwinia TaxID=2622719 RepID=UPI000C195F43|nr:MULTISPECIES: hypothetical protein [unclassified Erwinia]PIJ49619.1 hypothetical protein BV501_12185 [Erwinia sp. OAMSP11]PIJ71616.1 hypothetical protein BK416_11415 [Erwinia sp. OLSSP12]PIJ82686.1 hypothetical protein BLD47_06180 [Erwinia sp. OLCASP19]PIJ83153.1 hypothetical protein BLD46_10275 [Erwinia sp. OLMTSP26]PIJ85319.1 hypothetical protein BLD49_10835 [Erwinia sp. OLMDSP33]
MFNDNVVRIRFFSHEKSIRKIKLNINSTMSRKFSQYLRYIADNMAPSKLVGDEITPWCFVISVKEVRQHFFFLGTFLPEWRETADRPVALYCVVKKIKIISMLDDVKKNNLPFFLMRTLSLVNNKRNVKEYKKDLKKMCSLLTASLSSRRGLYKRMHRGNVNIEPADVFLQHDDFKYQDECGVENMPWINWPGCILNNNKIWLWRQNCVGRIIESQILDGPYKDEAEK